MKFFNEVLDKIITRLGKSNDSEIVTATLAAFKLIFIPISTMSDKKTTKEQKEYAIKRDLLTELVALAGYLGVTKVFKNNATAPICKKYYKDKAKKLIQDGKLDINSDEYNALINIPAKDIKLHAMNSFLDDNKKMYTPSQKENIQKIENVVKKFPELLRKPDSLYIDTKKTLSHICVCTLALTVIPFVTNKILEVMAKANETDDRKKIKINDKINPAYTSLNFSQYSNMTKLRGPICL